MTLRLFEAYGIELEYMIVSDETLAVSPISDRVLVTPEGEIDSELEMGDLCWSNELVLHVVELKTNGPAPALEPLPTSFIRGVKEVGERLRPSGARLLGGAMHPLMDPRVETHLWPHDNDVVYRTFDRIFGTSGHGWANLQSMHVNLPFDGDEELAALHSAIRFLLPIMPALSASSPIIEGKVTGILDNRLSVYRSNCARIPSITGAVVPEAVSSRRQYEETILQRLYRDIAPHDPEGILRHEWLNARGAIVRFDRSAIEIRVLDVQETPRADLAIAALISSAVRSLVTSRAAIHTWPLEPLRVQLDASIARADRAPVTPEYTRALSCKPSCATAGDVWRDLAERLDLPSIWDEPLSVVLESGPLARRILTATGESPSRERILSVYRDLADCLISDRLFSP